MQDTIIIGAGPAGLSAGLFCGLYKLETTVVGEVIGGQIIFAPMIYDYPGVQSINGKEWLDAMLTQVKNAGTELIKDKVTNITKNGDQFSLKTAEGKTFSAKSIIFATGNEKRRTNYSGIALAKSLGIEVTPDGFIASDNSLKTSVDGVYAAGNCLKYPVTLEQVINAAAQGTQAASHVNEYLKKEKAPILWGKASIRNP